MSLTTLACILATPIILVVITSLATLAVITSTLTSSFVFLRLTLLTIEIVSSITLDCTNWILKSSISRLQNSLWGWQSQQKVLPKKEYTFVQSPISSHFLSRPSPQPLSQKRPQIPLLLHQLPCRAPVNPKFSFSLPVTPDDSCDHHQMGI
ncbi:hypothetical protein CLU79DRAFT_882806 [Phycomyces nitens]|nr:hypothetical protein CLU79DRAFT_882806 [Phycomyces nitens]